MIDDVEREYAHHLLLKWAARAAQNDDGELAQYVRDAADVWNTISNVSDGGVVPSHICHHCGALWRFWPRTDTQDQEPESWELRSKNAQSCCNNPQGPMQAVVPLTWDRLLDRAQGVLPP